MKVDTDLLQKQTLAYHFTILFLFSNVNLKIKKFLNFSRYFDFDLEVTLILLVTLTV